MKRCRYTLALLVFSSFTSYSQDTSDVAISFGYFYQEGLKLEQEGRYEEAIALFERALKVIPDNIDARIELAQTLSWIREYRRAEEEYRKALDYQPHHFDAQFGLAQTLAWQARYGEALEEFRKLLVEYPKNAEILRAIGQVYFWVREHRKATEYLEKAVGFDPGSADAHLNLADAYYELQEWSKAHDHYQIVVRLVPGHPEALDRLERTRALVTKNQVEFYGFVEQFSQNERTPHYALAVRYWRKHTHSITLMGTVGFIRKKFGNVAFEDGSVGAGLAVRLAPKSVVSTTLIVSPGAEVIPNLDFNSEFSQSALSRIELFIGYRLMNFENVSVSIASPGLIYYFSDYTWAMLRAYGAFSEGATRTDAVFGRLSHTFSRVISAWVGFTEGNEVVRGLSLDNLRNLSSRSYMFHVEYSAWRGATLLLDYQYVLRRGLFTEHALGLGATYRW